MPSQTDTSPLEWRLQHAQVRALHQHADYGKRFLLAGDMNAGRRGMRAAAEAKATGMTRGEPDLRLYFEGGRLVLVENKRATGRLSPEQRERHANLQKLGFEVQTIRAGSTQDAEDAVLAIVMDILAS